MRSYWFRVGQKRSENVLTRDRRGQAETHEEDGDAKLKAEIAVMHLQVTGCQGCWHMPEARREVWDGFSPRASRSQPCPHLILDFWPPECRENKLMLL